MLYFVVTAILLQRVICDISCSNYHYDPQLNGCFQWENRSGQLYYHYKACDDYTQQCDLFFNTSLSQCKSSLSLPFQYPGEYCTDDRECYSQKCEKDEYNDGVCYGKVKDESCVDHSDCYKGLYCNSYNLCKYAKEIGESCGHQEHCISYGVCQFELCVLRGSLGLGEPATNPEACSTLFISNGLCAKGPKLLRKKGESMPKLCPSDGKCRYSDGSVSSCICGSKNESMLYCAPGIGDLEIEEYKNYMESIYKTGVDRCHISHGPLCLYEHIEVVEVSYFKAFIQKYNILHYVDVATADEAALNVFHYYYWYAKNEIVEDTVEGESVMIGIAVGIFVLLFVAFALSYSCRSSKSSKSLLNKYVLNELNIKYIQFVRQNIKKSNSQKIRILFYKYYSIVFILYVLYIIYSIF